MNELERRGASDFRTGCLITVAVVVGFVVVMRIISPQNKSTNSSGPYPPEEQIPTKRTWYEGGSLHKSKIKEWKVSTYENKLATCADFVARVKKEISLPESVALVACIDESYRGTSQVDEAAVAEMAAVCMMLLQNQK